MNLNNRLLLLLIILFSGTCWYLSSGLNGDFWWLFWIAPVPVLFVSYKLSSGKAFWVAFLAYLLGRLSWLSYLLSVVPVGLAIIFTSMLPLIFAVIILISRSIVLRIKNWIGLLAFPTLVVSFEYLLFHVTGDGTAGSIAYSQANCLPLIQIASITGILGIVFTISLFSSTVAWCIFSRNQRPKMVQAMVVGTLIITAVFFFGLVELYAIDLPKSSLPIGLFSAAESRHHEERKFNTEKGDSLLREYEESIAHLSSEGALIIVLPEKMITVTSDQDSAFRKKFSDIAIRNKVNLVVGYTLTKDRSIKNLSWIVSSQGQTLAVYQKVNLFEGEAREGFQRGDSISVFTMEHSRAGTAICKDMDYQSFLRKYGRAGVDVLFVPAWDFERDDWLHSRMSILRGVENGFGIARCARMGRLTISNRHGRVLAEASTSDGRAASVMESLPVYSYKTVFSYWGDWFVALNIILALFLILVARKNAKQAKAQK
ncbi:MAG: hypothetical protein C5B59_16245 [Bacteroidetes bacterium]|nr:MAG: hypothetical protein C5B59_16245 [Bacteroidota bacterium]